VIVAAVLLLVWAPAAGAQYFGRNKVQHRTFDFKVLKTQRFDIYYYPEEAGAASIIARMAERWHDRLSRFFGHDLRGRQAIILYAGASHFRQTNAIEGLVGEGTGGVTEAIKRRIVIPMAGSLADTHHVLGHELVHAFQFDLTGDDPRDLQRELPDILQFPLWYVEGMAEYLSLGPVDAQTAMWLRDAALRERLPHVRDLNDPRYFPYRWGHAFWAFVGAKYGDRAVASLIRSAANPAVDLTGLARQLGSDPDTLTADWHHAIGEATQIVARDLPPIASRWRLAIDEQSGGGRMNIGPRVSPDGKQVAFFSEKDLFSVDLYIADVATGKIRRKLSQAATDPHFDSLEFLNSAGAWSPDGTRLAIAASRGGRPALAIFDTQSGRLAREIPLATLDEVLGPAFAPDGRSLVVAGNRGGFFDLYQVALETGQVVPLTADAYVDLEPVFTPDGRSIVFVSERFTTNLETLEPGALRLARLDLSTREVTPIPGFLKGKHLSPQITGDGQELVFIAEPDGVSNLYKMRLDGGPIMQVSSFPTGVAGITDSSPALSASASSGRLVFSVFENDGHAIYVLDADDIVALVPPAPSAEAAVLAGRTIPTGDVYRFLNDFVRGLPEAAMASTDAAEAYDHKLKLDFIGQPMVAAGISSYGAYIMASGSAFFSDMLGDRQLGVAVQVAGKLRDFGGEVFYTNRRHRWNWSTSAQVWPYTIGYLTFEKDVTAGELRYSEVIERQTSRGVFGRTAFPFNSAIRFEVGGGARALSFSRDARIRVYSIDTGDLIERREIHEPIGQTLYLAETSLAIVRDTSFFGATGPLYGSRSRLEVGQSIGTLRYTSVLADWRRYFMPKRPVTVGVRAMHFGRYGRDEQHPQLLPLYAGYPEILRGYGYGSFNTEACRTDANGKECVVFDTLQGSRLFAANIEARVPLRALWTGKLEYGHFPLDVGAFFDAATTWSAGSLPAFAGGNRAVLRSVGGFTRANVFGLMIIEVAAAHPIDRPSLGWQWQIGMRQGF
jgi:Tol biopolymer transport system component